MKSVGIISEYNPFHNGHRYQIERAREMSGADCAIAVMSGNYVQRGDVAIFSKYERAKSAVWGGVDIVFELPAYFSLKSAEGFAKGGIFMLKALGVDAVSFGAECENLSLLKETAEILKAEKGDFKKILKEGLKSGKSFASARSDALSHVFKKGKEIVLKPNNILATEYLAAMDFYSYSPEIYPVKRVGTGHDTDEISGEFSSASNIRKMLLKGEDAGAFVPALPSAKPIFLKDFEKLLLYCTITLSCKPSGGSDGLYERIVSANKENLEGLLMSVKTKRFALSRIKRYLVNLMLQNSLPENLEPSYLRVLALNKRGAEFLKDNSEKFTLPVISKPSAIPESDPIFALERRGSRIRALVTDDTKDDIYMSPIFVK